MQKAINVHKEWNLTMSNHYEMMYILRPDLSEDQVNEAVNKYTDFLSQRGAENIDILNRGKKRLAYPVKKFLDGIYIQVNYQADGTQVAPLERAMRLSEEVIRYMTLKLKKSPKEALEQTDADASTEEE
ncbi:30S ribosomal protein S6 [Hyella patelloides LEGE 07179]|uniref:Small ribosomal subunit protein bS6 n=2 Tax=Hyella TaxID=945733 RepID=A0A563VXU0_9CYAN|nr:30S ribosomal protein S6 [Hyella patelloides LEGE 07179]